MVRPSKRHAELRELVDCRGGGVSRWRDVQVEGCPGGRVSRWRGVQVEVVQVEGVQVEGCPGGGCPGGGSGRQTSLNPAHKMCSSY